MDKVFGPNWLKNGFLVGNSENYVGIRISIPEIPFVPIFRQNGQLWLFQPKFAQKWILRSKFQKYKSGFGISTSKIPYEPIFSQNGKHSIFRPRFGEITCDILVLITLRVLQRAGWRLKWLEWRWMELGGGWNGLGGGRWSWMELGGGGYTPLKTIRPIKLMSLVITPYVKQMKKHRKTYW